MLESNIFQIFEKNRDGAILGTHENKFDPKIGFLKFFSKICII